MKKKGETKEKRIKIKKSSKKYSKKEIKIDEGKLRFLLSKKVESDLSNQIEDAQFQEFFSRSPIEIPATTLRPIEAPIFRQIQQIPDLETATSNAPVREENQIRYAISNEPIYSSGTIKNEGINYNTTMQPPVLTTRTANEMPGQQFLDPLKWIRNPPELNIYPERAGGSNIEGRRRLPFEKQDKKYQDAKLSKRY